MKHIIYILGVIALISCQKQNKPSMTEEQFRQKTENINLQNVTEEPIDSTKWNSIREEVRKANPNSSDAFIEHATTIKYQSCQKSLYDAKN